MSSRMCLFLLVNTDIMVLCMYKYSKCVDWFNGNIVGHSNEVTQRRAQLVLRWMTIHGYVS